MNYAGDDSTIKQFLGEQTPLKKVRCAGCGRWWLSVESLCPHCGEKLVAASSPPVKKGAKSWLTL